MMLVIRLRNSVVISSHLVQAALLHDTVEDTDTSFEELRANFGDTVARIVQEVTDDKTLPKHERKLLQVEHARHSSHQAKLVKLADKLYNLRDLNRCTPVGKLMFQLSKMFDMLKCFKSITNFVSCQVGQQNGFRSILYGQLR